MTAVLEKEELSVEKVNKYEKVFETRKVLVLNKCWTPINTITLRDAITLVFSEHDDGVPKARIIEPESYSAMTWQDWSNLRPSVNDDAIRSANLEFRVPEIILLSHYDKMPKPRVHFSRRTLFKRDKHTCQFCGKRPRNDEWTVDHIIPRAQGGKTTWENCVLACYKCNSKKANRTPKQAGMTLLSEPTKPDLRYFKCDLTHKVDSWQSFLGSAYWSVELENDNEE